MICKNANDCINHNIKCVTCLELGKYSEYVVNEIDESDFDFFEDENKNK
jgi:hypothetical protein